MSENIQAPETVEKEIIASLTFHDHTPIKQHPELMNQIENHFQIEFTLDEIISFKNVGDLIDCLALKNTQ